MRNLLAVVLAVVLITIAYKADGKVVPASNVENQQISTQPLQISDYYRQAQNLIDNLAAQMQENLKLPNQDEFVNTIKDHSTNFANNLQTYLKNVSEEIKSKTPEVENLWNNMKTKLNDAIEKLNINPEVTEQVNQLHTKFQEGVQTILTESNNAVKSLSENSSKVQEDMAKFTKQAIDLAVQASQNLNSQMQQAATPQS